MEKARKMTYFKDLPPCNYRYGRTEIIENEECNKKTVRIIICCGYREVDPEECIYKCTGFPNAIIKLSNDFKLRRYIICVI